MQPIYETIAKAKKENNLDLIWSLWKEMGSVKKSSSSALYSENSIFYVDEIKSLVYCAATYTSAMNWSTISEADLAGTLVTVDGVTVEVFKIIVEEVEIPGTIADFSASSLETPDVEVNISDKELYKLLTPLGAPLITMDQLELNREELINYYLSPCLDVYYAFFPIVVEQSLSVTGDFDVPFPDGAFNAIMWVTGGGVGIGSGRASPFAVAQGYAMGAMVNGGMGGRFGHGLYYNKKVPGFTGSQNYYERMGEMMGQAQLMQTMKNVFRRVKFQKKLIDGNWHATGYAMSGGKLNIKWMEKNSDWSAIPTDMMMTVRPYCQGYILSNISSLRSIVSDAEIPTNAKELESKGTKMMEDVLKVWQPRTNMFVTSRGATTF